MPTDLGKLARGQVGLENPVVRSPFVRSSACGNAGLILFEGGFSHFDFGRNLESVGQFDAAENCRIQADPERRDLYVEIGNKRQDRSDRMKGRRPESLVARFRQMNIQLGV